MCWSSAPARGDDGDDKPRRKPPGGLQGQARPRAGAKRNRSTFRMRVVGGRLRGRTIASPSSRDIRPTADRLRESLFNILMHAYGDPVERCARARPVCRHRRARHRGGFARCCVHAVRRQRRRGARAAAAECRGARARRRDQGVSPRRDQASVRRIRSSRSRWRSSIRPTARAWRSRRWPRLREGGWLTPQALLVVEEATSAKFAAPEGFEELERRAYDDTEFVILRGS